MVNGEADGLATPTPRFENAHKHAAFWIDVCVWSKEPVDLLTPTQRALLSETWLSNILLLAITYLAFVYISDLELLKQVWLIFLYNVLMFFPLMCLQLTGLWTLRLYSSSQQNFLKRSQNVGLSYTSYFQALNAWYICRLFIGWRPIISGQRPSCGPHASGCWTTIYHFKQMKVQFYWNKMSCCLSAIFFGSLVCFSHQTSKNFKVGERYVFGKVQSGFIHTLQ